MTVGSRTSAGGAVAPREQALMERTDVSSVKLQSILDELHRPVVDGEVSRSVSDITYDSRAVTPGSLFVAVQGMETDGNRYAEDAVRRGAVAVLSAAERVAGTDAATWIRVDDDRRAMAHAAAAFHGHPERQLATVGITGTNGKTTTAFLLESILEASGRPTGLVGTVCFRWPGHQEQAPRTTPESVDISRFMRCMVEAGCGHAILEASSHALALHRVEAVRFQVGVFTNLTHDHLDFHRDMESYFAAKATLFRSLPANASAVLNANDARSTELRRLTAASVLTYGDAAGADVRLLEATYENCGTRARLATPAGELELYCHLAGPRNLENVMAAAAAALSLDVNLEAITIGVEALHSVPGRWERIECGQPFQVVVDFAHTDDALRKLLAAVRALQPARIITVFGCGGDRDRSKRSLMGEAAATGSDVVILSSDNPRGEDPHAIADHTQRGIDAAGADIEMHRILDRGEAIRFAIELARPGDTVVIAGKGHENVQIIRGRSFSFDDREQCRSALERRFGGGDRG